MVVNNINILTCILILLTQWNNDISSTFSRRQQSPKLAVQALFQMNGSNAMKKKKKHGNNYDILTKKLRNDEIIPKIGVGLANVPHNQIFDIINAAFSMKEEEQSNLGYRLIDTSRSSGNEKLISEALSITMTKNYESNSKLPPTTIHIVTKVYYTHLGYERTKISIEESLSDLLSHLKNKSNIVKIKVHILIEWPMCYSSAKFMNCEEEEKLLPSHIQDAGDTKPLENPYAYLGSWRALEEIYKTNSYVASIGVSNFEHMHMDVLLQSANIKPHIYQGNLEMISTLGSLLSYHRIHPQVYGLFKALTSERPVAKIDVSKRHLISLTNEFATYNNDNDIDPATILLSFLASNSLGVMVRTKSQRNLISNSPKKIVQVPILSTSQYDRLLHIVDSLHFHWKEEEDEQKVRIANEKVHVTFNNKRSDDQNPVDITYIQNNKSNDEESDHTTKLVAKDMKKGQYVYLESQPGHVFVVKDSKTGEEIHKYEVKQSTGRAEWFSIEL